MTTELSAIQRNQVESARLAEAMAEFQKRGGVVEALPGFGASNTEALPAHKPVTKPYGRDFPRQPPARQIPKSKRVVAAEERANAKSAMVRKVRELAATMTKAEIMRETGLSGYTLRKLGYDYGIEFRKFDPTPFLKPNALDRSHDAANIERLVSARDRGLTRKQAMADLGISNSLMYRLIEDYGIDYPLQRVRKK
ncbi:hypothetical protein GIV19_16765 [Pseudomonas syringae]|uniref:hypothetical protein n=1 Tax=Pseudomonas syringae TaxID=317 RepID=UPI001F4225AA|nr:hypothetical protein [Pseudomonas syringae]MCF5708935.1 hypothetical protein [Pseudomonas syringae]